MDLRQIRYFCAVADAGSFSAGARRAFVTQPTLSAASAALEAELDARLFERGARGVRLTAAGRRALGHARAALREAERLKAAGGPAAPARPLRLGVLPSLSPGFVAATLTRLAELDPAQPWRSEDAPLPVLRRRLAAGRYAAILTSLAEPAPGHRQRVLARDGRPRGRITPAFLQGRPLIVRTHCEQLQAASRILDHWRVRPRVVAHTDDDARALALVAAGLGACLLPDSFRHPGVAFLRPLGVSLPRRLGLEWIGGADDPRLAGLAAPA